MTDSPVLRYSLFFMASITTYLQFAPTNLIPGKRDVTFLAVLKLAWIFLLLSSVAFYIWRPVWNVDIKPAQIANIDIFTETNIEKSWASRVGLILVLVVVAKIADTQLE